MDAELLVYGLVVKMAYEYLTEISKVIIEQMFVFIKSKEM
jgi:hypothetical protein